MMDELVQYMLRFSILGAMYPTYMNVERLASDDLIPADVSLRDLAYEQMTDIVQRNMGMVFQLTDDQLEGFSYSIAPIASAVAESVENETLDKLMLWRITMTPELSKINDKIMEKWPDDIWEQDLLMWDSIENIVKWAAS